MPRHRGAHLELVFTFTLATSAILLFWIQPMFAKMVLPLLGGTPAVWNTAMVFYQACLLAGYAYAHFSTRYLDVRKQSLLHLGVLLVAFTTLPIGVAVGWTPPTDSTPVLWLIALFLVSIGLPFFALSATAPLLQKWFSHTTHEDATNPYFLYAASNAGSIVALLAYPLLVEPVFGIARQSWLWSATYVALFVLMAVCAVLLHRYFDAQGPHNRLTEANGLKDDIGWGLRSRWILLAFIPSSLLLGVTTHITTDIASVPLLWVIPLTLYLLTFVVVFAKNPLISHSWMVRIQVYLVMVFVIALHLVILSSSFTMIVHLATFFVTAMVCHGELAKIRPQALHLTEFYLWMSLGGMLGGIFNALIAPLVFATIAEYPIAIVLACAVRPMLEEGRDGRWILDLLLPLALAAVFWVFSLIPESAQVAIILERWQHALIAAGVAIVVFSFSTRPIRFALGVAVCLVAATFWSDIRSTVHAERSFFGVHRVKHVADVNVNFLIHGSTIHGAQSMNPDRWREPLAYYTREGPIGQVFAHRYEESARLSVGVVGLGAGTTACYKRPEDTWKFFEIDPSILAVARDERYFHFLTECAPNTPTVLGDARLSLVHEADGVFDLLVIDAFSSDSIPVNLITAEAFDLYFDKIAAGGLLVAHVSSRFLNLQPVLGNLAESRQWVGLIQPHVHETGPTEGSESHDYSRMPSIWVVIARDKESLGALASDSNWRPLGSDEGMRLWTDDFSNIMDVMWGFGSAE
jgi:hypothetical protein